ncbi:MAG: EamA family transporter, partial [Bacteroidota bacterium]
VWGSTYLANWYAIQDIPPFLMSGSRFLVAGILLYFISQLFGVSRPTFSQWKNATWLGVLLLAIGTGGVVWAEQYVPSGIAALLIALQPLFMVLLMWKMRGKKPTVASIGGTLLGMLGMAFLVGQAQFTSSREMMIGTGVIFFSILAWGFAMMMVAKVDLPENKLQSAGMQMMGGGAVLLLASLAIGEPADFQWTEITARGIWSWIYLVIFGSIVAFSAFTYLLIKSTPDKVATSNYVNPVVALFLGWWLNSEVITSQSLLAAALMIAGVVFIKTKFSFSKKASSKSQLTPAPESLPIEENEATKEIHFTSPEAVPATGVIARTWHGMTPAEKAGEYVEWAKRKVVPAFQNIPGHLGMTLHRRNDGEVAHLTMVSYWRDVEAIKVFAGENYSKARYYPEERKWLLEMEEEVEHREVGVI